MTPFSDPDAVARYAEGPARQVPGYLALQTMTAILLAERAPADGHILVIGAGGGLELRVFAEMQPRWHFTGVDPSAEMLALATRTLGPYAPRVTLHHGLTDTAPPGPFDAASCLLTLHFLTADQRRNLLAQAHRRLAPGAPFVMAHHSFPQDPVAKTLWLTRNAAFAAASGVPAAHATASIEAIGTRLPLLSPAEDEALLHEAGFTAITPFFAAFTFRGWVAYKA